MFEKEDLEHRQQIAKKRWELSSEEVRQAIFVLIYADWLRLTDSQYRQPNCAKCSTSCPKCKAA